MIKPYEEIYKESLKTLKQYQEGNFKPVVTGFEWLDDTFGGVLPGDIICVAGASGSGKTHMLMRLVRNIFTLNDSKNYVALINSLEMKNLAILIREFNTALGKSKKAILMEEFTEEEKELLRQHSKLLNSGRFFINEETKSPEKFIEEWDSFLKENSDKEIVIITFDHMALIESSGDKKIAIDTAVEGMNKLKKKYHNVVFILLSQLNRSILSRIAEKSNQSVPQRSDLYASDTIFHICDHIFCLNNANRLGISEYMKVNPQHFEELSEFFSDPDAKKVSFLTYANIFIHVLKSRENSIVFKDLYIEKLDVPNRELHTKQTQQFSDKSFEDSFGEDINF